jgi:hypothetical protein
MFFTYRQNNSGGSFVKDENVDEFVIIQAKNADEANEKAEKLGIYFHGVGEGKDCPCCGDRWWPVSDDDGTKVPCLYGDVVPTDLTGIKIHYLE